MLAFLLFLTLVISSPPTASAAALPSFTESTQVMIGFNRLDWQTYDFYPRFNTPVENVTQRWVVDGKQVFYLPTMRYYFDPGIHRVTLVATDTFGANRYDNVKLLVLFWSLHNATMWWVVYALVLLLIFYYWGAKVIYLWNRKLIRREARDFLDILDTHGYIDHMIEAMAEKNAKRSPPST